MKRLFWILAAIPILTSAIEPEERNKIYEAFQKGREADEKGNSAEAFRIFLGIPGGEYAATRIARAHPKIATKQLDLILNNRRATSDELRVYLVKAEIFLAEGKKEQALRWIRNFSKAIAPPDSGKGWEVMMVPSEYYPVLPKKDSRFNTHLYSPALPFETGPGSHVDNWLLRRFIGLEAWADATAEFSRIQALHDKRPGPDTLALQFALDHAFFLMERDRSEEARTLLQHHLRTIDLDLRPEPAVPTHWMMPIGISHDEFIRLCFGAFKKSGHEAELIKALEAETDNRIKRVLAKIRTHQGQMDEALKLELAYIAAGDFSPISTAIRKGKIYQSYNHHEEAAKWYEKALALPAEQTVNLPIPKRQPHRYASSILIKIPQSDQVPTALYRIQTLEALEKCYEGLGRARKILETRLKRWDENPAWANHFDRVEALARLARSTDQEAFFRGWADVARKEPEKWSAMARANIAWVRDDTAATTVALREAAKTSSGQIFDFEDWMKRYREKGGDQQVRELLEALSQANPKVSRYQLEYLNLVGEDIDNHTLIAMFEPLFAHDAQPAFRYGKGVYNRTQFENYFDLAHRLMRLYLRTRQPEKMKALGLRMAALEKPFRKPSTSNDRGHPEQSMAFLISQASDETLAKLKPLLTEENWPHGKRHLSWVLDGGVNGNIERFRPVEQQEIATPPVTAIFSDENVLDLARNDSFVFAGQPWGVSVYDFDGKLLRQVAIGEAALRLAANETELWVGTAIGLRHIDLKTWKVSQLRADQEIPEENRNRPDYSLDFRNGITGLAIHKGTLWVGSRQNIRTLDLKTREMRIFSRNELKMKHHADWGWFHFEEEGNVWAVSGSGTRRYDPDTDTWAAPIFESPRDPARLLGEFDGNIWADIYIDDELRHRPAIIDPVTLQAEPVRIAPSVEFKKRRYLSDFYFFGRYDGKLVFGPGAPTFFYNPETRFLEPLPKQFDRDKQLSDTIVQPGHRYQYHAHRHDGTVLGERQTWLPLPNGRVVMGKRHSRSPRYIYPSEDWPFESMVGEQKDQSGGLHWFDQNGVSRRVSGNSGLESDTVFDFHFSNDQTWLCTGSGISLASGKGQIMANFGRDHGLPCNRSTSVTELKGKLYFASRHDDHGGAVIEFDQPRSRFTTITVIDGLFSNAVESVSNDGEQLLVDFGVEYRRHLDYQYQQYPRCVFDPSTNRFPKRPQPKIFNQNTAGKRAAKQRGKPMPILGGSIITRKVIAGKTWLAGTRGVLVLPGEDAEPKDFALELPEIEVQFLTDPRHQWLTEARKLRGKLPAGEALQHENPFIVADAMARLKIPLSPEDLEFCTSKLTAKFMEIRSTAAIQLYRTGTPQAVKSLSLVARDPVPEIRALAALAVTRHTDAFPVEALDSIFRSRSLGNPIIGAESQFGIGLGPDEAHRSIAARGSERITPEVFKFLLKYPPRLPRHDPKGWIFPDLGAAVKANPELARVLLSARNTRTGGITNRDFSRDVFRFTGNGVLPILHEGLTSKDRIVRANAALGCGAVGDAQSIQPLLAALDLESGLSKGAIVWALGELKAENSIARLTSLYLEARIAEKQKYASGMQFAQVAEVNRQQKRQLASIEQLQSDWDELKGAAEAATAPADPRRDEPLLSPRMILEALKKIGPEKAQDFYRGVAAGEEDHDGKFEAARMLAEALENEREKSIKVLKVLAANPRDPRSRIAATVSLIKLNEIEPVKESAKALLRGDWKGTVVKELRERLTEKGKITFARDLIRQIANDPKMSSQIRGQASDLLR